jgi:signal transduction histidine kinase/CheY-like chemotaxis protein/HPt (histidine-containing phosphotransfer) domain-containing protein
MLNFILRTFYTHRTLLTLLIPIMGIVVVGGAVYRTQTYEASHRWDQHDQVQDATIVGALVTMLQGDIAHHVMDSGDWDEARGVLGGNLTERWLSEGSCPFAEGATEIAFALRMSSDGEVKYLSYDEMSATQLTANDLQTLRRLQGVALQRVGIVGAVPLTGWINLQNRLWLVAVAPFMPATVAGQGKSSTITDVVIVARHFENKDLQHLGEKFGLSGLRLSRPASAMQGLPDPWGMTGNWGVSWDPKNTGTKFFSEAASNNQPLVVLVLVLLMGHILAWLRLENSVEAAHRRAISAEDLSKMKSMFLANMSHELRTPLNGVLGMMNLLRQTGLNKRQENLLEASKQAGESLLAVVNDILDISKIEAGKMSVEYASFDLASAVESASWMMAQKAQSKGLELSTFVSPRLPTMMRGDALRIQEVLANFISNAVKFTEMGEVTVTARLRNAGLEEASVRFEVSDTGPGIDKDAIGSLFQNFSQLGSEISRKYGGTGLGLAISAKLVELMQGRYGVTSIVGQGSTFWFELPIAPSDQVDITEPNDFGNLKALVVDDQAGCRSLLAEYVSSWGMKCETAANGNQALVKMRDAALEGRAFSIIIIDQDMPGIDGLTAARKIKSDPELSAAKIVLLSPIGSGVAEQDLAAHFIDACVVKPARHLELFGSIMSILQIGEAPAMNDMAIEEPRAKALSDKGRILIAEDNPVNLKVTKGYVECMGYTVDTATSGAQAVEAALHCSYDAILMDCRMPGMDGLEATREIRKIEGPGEHVPIIALSADVVDDVRIRCLQAGMDAFIAKPVHPDQLAMMLSRWVATNDSRTAAEVRQVRESLASNDDLLDKETFQTVQAALMTPGSPHETTIIDVFFRDAEWRIAELARLLARSDAKGIAECAHGLKGAASEVGAIRLIDISRQIDANAKLENLSGLPQLIELLDREFRKTKTLIQDMVA